MCIVRANELRIMSIQIKLLHISIDEENIFSDQTSMQSHSGQDKEHLEGECRLERHLAQDAQRHLGAGSAVQGVRHEEVSAEHEQRAEEASTGQKQIGKLLQTEPNHFKH